MRLLRDDFAGYKGIISEYAWAETLWEHPKAISLFQSLSNF